MPRSRQRAPNEPLPPAEPSRLGAGSHGDAGSAEERVLLLDDDPAIGRAVKLILETAGMDCVAVTRVGDFFETIDRWQPTHLLLDMMMPGMDGVEVMSSLAERGCNAYLILISGIGSQLLDAARRAADANGLNVMGAVEKPFSAAKLVAVLRRCGSEGAVRGGDDPSAAPLALAESDIEHAIRRNEFRLVYQPKVRCDTAELVGFEVLLRWMHPKHGAIAPDVFIPVAEESGWIVPLTRVALEQAVGWLVSYEHPRATLSVNISARCLQDVDFTDHLVGLCGHFGIDPARLVLELTETAATDDPVAALNILTRLRLRGVALAIDDFGTGYSSMAQLAQLPFSEIKIDKSFVIPADRSARARSIIQSTIDLGRQLQMRVTAEGVETPHTFKFLRDLGCDYAQGFLIARPLEGNTARDWQGVADPSALFPMDTPFGDF